MEFQPVSHLGVIPSAENDMQNVSEGGPLKGVHHPKLIKSISRFPTFTTNGEANQEKHGCSIRSLIDVFVASASNESECGGTQKNENYFKIVTGFRGRGVAQVGGLFRSGKTATISQKKEKVNLTSASNGTCFYFYSNQRHKIFPKSLRKKRTILPVRRAETAAVFRLLRHKRNDLSGEKKNPPNRISSFAFIRVLAASRRVPHYITVVSVPN